MNIELSNSKQKSVHIVSGMEGVMGVTGMTISNKHTYIAVAYKTEKVPIVAIQEVEPKSKDKEKKDSDRFKLAKQLVSSDVKSNYQRVVNFSAHVDKWLFTVGSDNNVLLWQWDKQKILGMFNIDISLSLVKEMRFNPQDNCLFTFLGDRTITLLEFKEGQLTKKEASRKVVANFNGLYTTHSYFVDKNNETKVFVCASTSEVLIFDKNCEFKSIVRIQFPDKFKSMEGLVINKLFEQNKKLFAGCSNGTILLVNSVQNKDQPLEVMKGWTLEEAKGANVIEVACNPDSTDGQFIVGTDNNQIIMLQLDTKDKNNDDIKKEYMISENPYGGILDLDVCLFKKQVAVASEDNIVRIYSLNTFEIRGEPIIREEFTDTPVSVAFHPSGINVIVAFRDKVKLYNIFRDKLCVFKEQTLKDVRMVRFSPSGRLFAVSNGNAIKVWDFWSGESQPQWFLKEHNGKIRSFKFYLDDTQLLSSDQLGVVIMWNLFPKLQKDEKENKKNFEKVYAEKNMKIDDVELSKDPEVCLTLCNGKSIKLIKDKVSKLELESEDSIGKIVLSQNQRQFFAGIVEKDKLGTLRMQTQPSNLNDLKGVGEFEDQQAHHERVTAIRLAENGIDMLTASKDGSVIFWKIMDTQDADQFNKMKDSGGAQNEMVLMDKDEQELNEQSIQKQESELKKLKLDTIVQLELLEKKFNEDQDREERKLNDEINDYKLKNDKINNEIISKERDFERKKASLMESYNQDITRNNEEWKLKIEDEEERIEKLKLDKEAKEQKQRLDKEDKEKSHSVKKEGILNEFEDQKKMKQNELDELKVKIKVVNTNHKNHLEKMEAEQNKKLDLLQTKYKQERKTQQDNLTNSHCQLLLTEDNKRKNDLELSTVKVRNEKLNKDLEAINSAITELENQIEHIKKDITQREAAIKDKDETIEEEKRKNQELEKFKFVLNQKIEELKRDIDPLENELKQLQTQSVQMKTEINHFLKVNSNLRLIVDDLNMKQEGLVNEKEDLATKITNMRNFKERFIDRLNDTQLKVKEASSVDVTEETGFVSIQFNKKLLKKEIIELYNTYVNQKDVSGILETNEQKKRNQRKFLEKSVDGLKNKMKTHRKGMNLENNKITKENMQLISQINKLRKDLKQIDNENMEMETQDHDRQTGGNQNIDLSSAILQLDTELEEGKYIIDDLLKKKQELEQQLMM